MIAKKPKSKPASAPAAKAFLGKANKRVLKPIIINVDVDLLARIDLAASESGLNRTAFIINAVSEKLRAIAGGNGR
jgi:hypothetical protein